LGENAEVVIEEGGGVKKTLQTSLLVRPSSPLIFTPDLTIALQIGADGLRSVVRSAMGVKYSKWEYKQSTIVGTLRVVVVSGPASCLKLGKGRL